VGRVTLVRSDAVFHHASLRLLRFGYAGRRAVVRRIDCGSCGSRSPPGSTSTITDPVWIGSSSSAKRRSGERSVSAATLFHD